MNAQQVDVDVRRGNIIVVWLGMVETGEAAGLEWVELVEEEVEMETLRYEMVC